MTDETRKKTVLSVVDKAMATIAPALAIEKTMQSFANQQSSMNKAMAAIAPTLAIEKTMQLFANQQSSMDKAMATIARPLAIEKAMQLFANQQSSMDKAMAAIAPTLAIEKVMQSFDSQQSVMNKTLGRLATDQSMVQKTLNNFLKSSRLLIDQPECFQELASATLEIEREDIDYQNIEYELIKIDNIFEEINDPNDFVKTFKSLPSVLQIFLLYFFLQIFLPQVNSISANLLTPAVESYLTGNFKSDREKIKGIKKIPLLLDGVETDGLRFVTGDNVRLREYPSTKSEILDELVIGQIVTVLSKDRNWIEVMYEYEGGEHISGWIFTRYTAKFVR